MAYGEPLGLSAEQLDSLAAGTADDPVWAPRERVLVRLADELHDTSTVSDALWEELHAGWTAEQLVELVALAGFYHLVAYATNAFAVEREEWAATLP